MKTSVRITTLALMGVLARILLTIAHPMLRTVEPQVIHYSIVVDGLSQSEQDMVLEATSAAFASW